MTVNATDLDAEVAAIKAAHEAATRARMRAEHARDTAEAQAAALRKKIAAEFGVDSVELARDLLAALEEKLAEAAAEARRKLDEVR